MLSRFLPKAARLSIYLYSNGSNFVVAFVNLSIDIARVVKLVLTSAFQ